MPHIKHIHWNRLHFDIPEDWEVIVKDGRHLILEAELKPLLEIRWQPPGPKRSQTTIDKIAGQIQQETGYLQRPELLEHLSANLQANFSVQGFDQGQALVEPTLLLTCSTCATIILIRLYHNALSSLTAQPRVFNSLCCHPRDEEKRIWRIQDFFFWLPDGFELDASAFQFGLTNLHFKSKTTDLTFCRLATAARHLSKNSLEVLFESLCSASLEEQVADGPATLRYRHDPHPVQRLWSRLRRRKSYQAAKLAHFPTEDRILGYTIRSFRPIEESLNTMIENGYGIVQEKKDDTGSDPGSGTGLHTGQK